MGVKDLKELVLFVCKLANGFVKSMQDGKFNLLELVNFVPAVTALPAAIDNIDEVPAQLKDMDDAEREEIIQAVKDELDFEDEDIEEFVEDAFAVVLPLLYLILRAKDVFTK